MASSANKDLVPPFSETFQVIEKEWKELIASTKELVRTSAFCEEHTLTYRNTFSVGNTVYREEPLQRVVYSISDVLTKYSELADFFDRYADTMRIEAETYFQKYKGTLWFFKALDTLHNPSDEDSFWFSFFQTGEWNGYDLCLETYNSDKARKEKRGKTKNPNFVSQDTHICPPNCLCYWDDTPEYQWRKEDKEESLASNNIRINWKKREQFEREFLTSDMLETLKPCWEHWTPKEHWYEFPNLKLCKEFADRYSIAVKPAVIIMSQWLWKLPREFYFLFLWQNRFRFRNIAELLRSAVVFFQKKYEENKAEEDEIVEGAKQNIRVLSLKDCYEEIETIY